MKEFTFLLFCLLISNGASQAQNTTPTAVLDAFAKLQPEIKNPFWEVWEGVHVAMFGHEEGLKKVLFDQEGQWLETRTRLMAPDLPKAVRAFVEQLYASALITYIGKVVRPTQTLFRVETESINVISIKLLNERGDLLQENSIELSLIPQ